ncbi:SDR family oxidoreductase [Salipiger sp. P9]|uniref:SDR family NAD(P)-dependent oxidoreductase n=1 Tax=Salipiger pentaromativorans TaxID=2943193 RepID=UPI0021585466|nr:glucose 1-dehydrogenase [Salipiger pentaromativorans]MCR8549252.1 SDR family oxidoreductase [Salipiger pentaromativorans]
MAASPGISAPAQAPVVLVTGAADGIGWATARAFAAEGARVVLVDLRADAAEARRAELGGTHLAFGADVSDQADVARMMTAVEAACGRIDVLVNNAGIPEQSLPTLEQDLDRFDRILDVHLRGLFLMSREAARIMLRQQSGAIVNVSSIVAIRGVPGRNGYGAAKAGVLAMTRAMACEWAGSGLRVNAVIPGYVRTELVRRLEESGTLDSARMTGSTPMGRLARPEEIADAIAYLASPRASFITGASLAVDGGWTASGMA